MNPRPDQTPQQPVIAKYVQPVRTGIQLQNFTRNSIGYVTHGCKYIYYGDLRHQVQSGELFYMGSGSYYIEDIPDEKHSFEQIVFFFSSEQLSRTISGLSTIYNFSISNEHTCEKCSSLPHVTFPAWAAMRNFFSGINQYLRQNVFSHDSAAEGIKITELIYLIISHPDCCLKSKLIGDTGSCDDGFKELIFSNIFTRTSIDKLADMSGRSLTSFKKTFQSIFNDPPHKWFLRQRLMHSRLLLVSSGKPITLISEECAFLNTSHFIKLFKKEYGQTPANYRLRHANPHKIHSINTIPAEDQAGRA